MARIRTIKPEFPQSESMGRVSREARLLFVQLWTILDDEGRARGNSRILASLLYPYDDDALDLIDGWIAELEREGCVARYIHDNSMYIQVLRWREHQKIDKPSKSRLPPFDESSRILANPREGSRDSREGSSGDLDLDQDLGRDQEGISQTRARENSDRSPSENPQPRVTPLAAPLDVPGGLLADLQARYPLGTYRQSEWLLAEREIRARLEEGDIPAEILAGVERYAAQARAKGSVGTQFVLSPRRFFAERQYREPFPLPATKADQRLATNLDAAAEFLSRTEPTA